MSSNKEPLNILFTCVGRRNYLVKYFKKALNANDKIVAVDMSTSASALREAHVTYKVSHVESPLYIDELKAIAKTEKIGAIISLNDIELPKLAEHKSEFEALGTRVLISDKKTVDICFDKWKTYLFLKEANCNTPNTFLSHEDALKSIKYGEITFPLIVKPRWGSASIGINEVNDEEELLLTCKLLKIKIRKSFQKQNNDYLDISKSIIIQEKIVGQEYGMDILNDFDGTYYGTYTRKKLGMRCGETDKAISVIHDDFTSLGATLGTKLGHVGNMDCDFFVSSDKIYFLEMNPRFGGGYPFSHNAGIDIPSIYVAWLKGEKEVDKFDKYVPGKGFVKYDQLGELNVLP